MKGDCEKCGQPANGYSISGRCNECHKCDDCGTKEHLIIAEGGVLCHDCLAKRINIDKENFNGDTDYTDNIICPHCGYEDKDSWECSESGEMDCRRCGEEFYMERDITVTYSTKKC